MWYIVDAKEGASLVYGMRKDIPLSDDEIKEAAQNGTLEINRTTAQIGDSIQVLAKADSGYKLNRLTLGFVI